MDVSTFYYVLLHHLNFYVENLLEKDENFDGDDGEEEETRRPLSAILNYLLSASAV